MTDVNKPIAIEGIFKSHNGCIYAHVNVRVIVYAANCTGLSNLIVYV